MDDEALFTNRNGEMLVEYNLFVPILPRVNISDFKPKDEFKDFPAGNHLRWVDNHDGKLMFNNSRMGGEFNGMTPVHLFGTQATLLHRGSYCWFGNCYTKRCMVYCTDSPKAIFFQSVIFNGESVIGDEYPYNITTFDPKNRTDIPKAVIPQAKSSAITFYR